MPLGVECGVGVGLGRPESTALSSRTIVSIQSVCKLHAGLVWFVVAYMRVSTITAT